MAKAFVSLSRQYAAQCDNCLITYLLISFFYYYFFKKKELIVFCELCVA
jgi:hypothetical protein